ncbi:hypothetical protein G7046_g2993 [Stylonectria norvegica]|nr:hypothetical protein G7046_g2993 [Stylonectria norvegica]
MRWTTSGAALALSLLGTGNNGANAAAFPRAVAGKGYLSVPVGTVNRPNKITKRANSIVTVLNNTEFFYATEISIGKPPQSVTVLVDTGSNELWVNPDCNNAPSDDQYKQCLTFGDYNPKDSTTPPIGPFGSETINYGDASDESTQTSVKIRYYADTLSFGDAKVKNQTFGIVTESSGISQGILGLAPDLRAGFDSNEPYSLVLSSMADQGVIASRVFALDLRHADDEEGAVIYGGLDRNKFIGKLTTVPIVKGMGGEFRLAVSLSSLGVTLDSSQEFDLSEDDTNVMLDSGTTISRMHYSAAFPILNALDAQDDGEGYYYVSCDMRDQDGSVDFGFGNTKVRVPFSDFILNVGSDEYCYVGIVITTDQQILGDTVLRAGYFVFDWDNEEVHIGQAANCGDNDIVAVGSGKDAVPSATGNCKSTDAKATGSAKTTTQSSAAALPTKAYTTTYTVTSCLLFDLSCKTGVVTTQTVGPAKGTVTVTAGAAGATSSSASSGDDDDSAGVRQASMSWALVAIGAFAARRISLPKRPSQAEALGLGMAAVRVRNSFERGEAGRPNSFPSFGDLFLKTRGLGGWSTLVYGKPRAVGSSSSHLVSSLLLPPSLLFVARNSDVCSITVLSPSLQQPAMVFTPPPWVPQMPFDPPDSITVAEFMNNDKYGRYPIGKSKNPYTCGVTGKSYSATEVVRREEYLSRAIAKRLGFSIYEETEWDKVVGLYSLNTIDYVPLTHAVHRFSGIVTPASAAYSAPELEHQLRSAGAKALFTCVPLLETALTAAKAAGIPEDRIFILPVPGFDKKVPFKTIDDLIGEGEKLSELPPLKWTRGQGARQVAYLCYSSGTSGLPKAVMISHRNVIANVLQLRTYNDVARKAKGVDTQVMLGLLPFSHIYGLVPVAHSGAYSGDEIIVLPRFELKSFLGAVQKFKMQQLSVVPPILIQMLSNAKECAKYDLTSIRFVFTGAAPLGSETQEELVKMFPSWRIGQGYGMTETCTVVFSTSELDINVGSSGSLLPGTKAKIISAEGKEVTKHETPGELWVQSPTVVLGYLHNEKATAETFIHDEDGRWIRTGDEVIVRKSAQGNEHFVIVDRIKELIKVKGHQVAPAELEAHLLAHHHVSDCAVIQVPDARAGEVPKAYIVKAAHSAHKTEDEAASEIHKHVEDHKARHKWLKGGD